MARYWVGGTGTWDASDTTHWSTTSGGAGGASAPTSSDDVIFNGSSGGGTVTCSGLLGVFLSLTCTGFTGTLTGTIGNCSGTIVLGSGGTFSGLSIGVSNTMSLTCAGKSFGSFSVSGGTTTCVDAFSTGILQIDSSATLKLKNGVTSSITSIIPPTSGANGNLSSASAGSQATLSDTTGTNTLNRMTVQDIAFTGGATWELGTNAVDNGNNTGLATSGGTTFDALFAQSLA